MTSRRLLAGCVMTVSLAWMCPLADAQSQWVHVNRRAATNANLVDLNTASKSELMTLPQVGEAEADSIIEGRPYATKQRLLDQKVVTRAVYEQIEKRITTLSPPPTR